MASWGRGLPQVRLGPRVSLKRIPARESTAPLGLGQKGPGPPSGALSFEPVVADSPSARRPGCCEDARSERGGAPGRRHPAGDLGLLQPDLPR